MGSTGSLACYLHFTVSNLELFLKSDPNKHMWGRKISQSKRTSEELGKNSERGHRMMAKIRHNDKQKGC